MSLVGIFIIDFLLFVLSSLEPIELVPKMIRRPTHLDKYLCRQLHNGLGVRAIANLSGELCRTYCRVMDRISGKVFYTENISPNFVRCGPYQARCVDGSCIGFNYPYGVINNFISSPSVSLPNNNDLNNVIDAINNPMNQMESAGLSNQDSSKLLNQQSISTPPTTSSSENILGESN